MGQGNWRTDTVQEGRRTWSREEAGWFLTAAAGTRYEACWIVLLGTGLRCSEAMGLCWSDIDFGRNILHIAQVAHIACGQVILHAPNTTAARRTIPIVPEVAQALREEQARQAERRQSAGAARHALDLALGADDGAPAQLVAVRRSFGAIAREAKRA